ncbi:unnamed protein product [Echinostoma caproni]|uniref:Reverse transcriptase domain-containing protein n=1 Tax=Echinostoma caproni TaxID=27848 RepID=A0A183A1U1_9TREM|nr:unnamed protein product [Echinostoma caproni]
MKVVGSNGRADLLSDIERVAESSNKLDLALNAAKCQLLTKQTGPLVAAGTWGVFEFKPVETAKDPGVVMKSDFSWGIQCEIAARKARG